MPEIALTNFSTAGGGLLQPNKNHQVYCNGRLVAVVGTQVASHGTAPHNAATITQGSGSIRLGNIAAARTGDYASCGHPITNGSPNCFGNGRASGNDSPVFGLVNSPRVYVSTYTSPYNAVDWNNFMNLHAVWGNPSNTTGTSYDISRSFFAPAGGGTGETYYVQALADSGVTVYVDGVARVSSSRFKDSPDQSATFTLSRGFHIVRCIASRTNEIYGQIWRSTYPYPWNGLMRDNAVFWHPNNYVTGWGTIKRLWYAPYSGNYVFKYSVDDILNFYIDGGLRVSHSGYSGTPPTSTQYVSQGTHVLQWDVYNGGGPGGVAFIIYDSGGVNGLWAIDNHLEEEARRGGWSVLIRRSSTNGIIWDSRTALNEEKVA